MNTEPNIRETKLWNRHVCRLFSSQGVGRMRALGSRVVVHELWAAADQFRFWPKALVYWAETWAVDRGVRVGWLQLQGGSLVLVLGRNGLGLGNVV